MGIKREDESVWYEVLVIILGTLLIMFFLIKCLYGRKIKEIFNK